MILELDYTPDALTSVCLPDAEPWPYAIRVKPEYWTGAGDECVLLSDSLTDLVGALIDGYCDLSDSDEDHDEATFARYLDLVVKATRTHIEMISTLIDSGDLVLKRLGDDALTALFQDKTMPFRGVMQVSRGHGLRSRQVSYTTTMEWDAIVPLILFVTDYLDADTTRPSGNIIWLDPTDELAYLNSLDRLGVIELWPDLYGDSIRQADAL
jgi:hypothetical protein